MTTLSPATRRSRLHSSVECPGCGETRQVSRSTFYGIRYGLTSGLCRPCAYARLGELHRQRAAARFADRFWEKVDRRGPDECWPWLPAKKGEHGKFMIRKRLNDGAHRVAWRLTQGPIPEGYFVCHHCDNPPCCNPAHLFLGTAADNSRDMVVKGRRRGGRPKPVTVTAEVQTRLKLESA